MLPRVNRLGVVLLLLACGSPPPPIYLSAPEPTIPLTETAVGPITRATAASLVALRAVLPGYTVIPVNVGTDPDFPTLEYQVFDNDTQMFTVVPSDEGTILNVHVLTSKVTIAGPPAGRAGWRVGAPFAGSVTDCQCWGGKVVCFRVREHIAVAFDKGCRTAIDARSRRINGVAIKKLVWSPKPFGGAEYGGAEYGDVIDLGP